MTQQKQQLEMVRAGSEEIAIPALPAGYTLRQYQEADRASYWRLFADVFATSSRLDNLRTASLRDGFHVITATDRGEVVASAVAAEYEREGHAERGSLQWVMADSRHTGQGLGKAIVAAATATLVSGGYEQVYLSTDDWRLPAIHVYLELGWRPFIYAPGMESRWSAVYEQLRRSSQDEFVVKS